MTTSLTITYISHIGVPKQRNNAKRDNIASFEYDGFARGTRNKHLLGALNERLEIKTTK